MSSNRWISNAIKHPGALRAEAVREGAITSRGTIKDSWLQKQAQSSNPTIKKRAVLALTLRKLRK